MLRYVAYVENPITYNNHVFHLSVLFIKFIFFPSQLAGCLMHQCYLFIYYLLSKIKKINNQAYHYNQ